MKFSQDVQNRRLAHMANNKRKKYDYRIRLTFINILEFLDDQMEKGDYTGIYVDVNDELSEFNIKSDGFYYRNKRVVEFEKKVRPKKFIDSLGDYVNSFEDYSAKLVYDEEDEQPSLFINISE